MKVNNRWLYCGLTFLVASLLLTGTHAISVWDDGYMEEEYRQKQQNKHGAKHFIKWGDRRGKAGLYDGKMQNGSQTGLTRCYEGHYDHNTQVFTAYDGDRKEDVSPDRVYCVGCPFRKDDRVACYLSNYVSEAMWKKLVRHGFPLAEETMGPKENAVDTTFMTTGVVLSVGLQKSLIQFDNAGIQSIDNCKIHGMTASVSKREQDLSFPRQQATARFRKVSTDECCDRLFEWSDNKIYEGHYDHGRHEFTAHDGDSRDAEWDSCFYMGPAPRDYDRVACYWTKDHTWLNPGRVIKTGYAFSLVEFDDGDKTWRPNEWIHQLQ